MTFAAPSTSILLKVLLMVIPNHSRLALRILVVDDLNDIAESMALLLRLDGHEVKVAFDGESALDIAEKQQPEVVFCDIAMPKMNGNNVAQRLRVMFGSRPLLVAITARDSEDDRKQSLRAGFDDYFVKPADPSAVRRLLRQFVNSHN